VAEEAHRNSTIPAATTDEQVGRSIARIGEWAAWGTVAMSLAYGAAVAASGAARGYPEGPAWALAHVITNELSHPLASGKRSGPAVEHRDDRFWSLMTRAINGGLAEWVNSKGEAPSREFRALVVISRVPSGEAAARICEACSYGWNGFAVEHLCCDSPCWWLGGGRQGPSGLSCRTACPQLFAAENDHGLAEHC
jgi:hypothetical protein